MLPRHTDSAEEILYVIARVVGFFSESEIISTFKEPVQPFGATVLNQGAPAPALA